MNDDSRTRLDAIVAKLEKQERYGPILPDVKRRLAIVLEFVDDVVPLREAAMKLGNDEGWNSDLLTAELERRPEWLSKHAEADILSVKQSPAGHLQSLSDAGVLEKPTPGRRIVASIWRRKQ